MTPSERAVVEERLGRPLQGEAEVIVRDRSGAPMVIRNAPFLFDGTPMPTRYWLIDPDLRAAVSRVESAGGVRQAEREIPLAAIEAAHQAYAAERDQAIDALTKPASAIAIGPDEHPSAPRPSGGVGGTRQGVKCLHAHVAHLLAGGEDVVGTWTLGQLGITEHDARQGRAPRGTTT